MLNVSDAIKNKYKSDEFNGDVSFTIDNEIYSPSNILADSTIITESISSGEDIDFRAVEKSCLETTLINITEDIKELKGKTLTMAQTVMETEIPLGVYTIDDAVNDGDYLYDITAYDNLYKFDVDVSDWWNVEVTFPITLRDLLISLCTKVEVPYDFPATFINSTFEIQQNTYMQEITGTEFLGYIQELCVSFIKPDRYGTMRMLQIGYVSDDVLYPSESLYPSETLCPTIADSVTPRVLYNVPITMDKLQMADYEVARIDRLQVRGTSDDIGLIVGSGANTYIIEANPLLYSFTGSNDDIEVATRILVELNKIGYTPVSTTVKALPYIEVGDLIQFISYEGKVAVAPLLNRSMSGFLLTRDRIDIKGSETREGVSSSSNKIVRVLNQKLHEYVNSLTEFRSTIRDVSSEITALGRQVSTNESSIEQLSESITLTVSNSIQQYVQDEGIDQFIADAKMTFAFTLEGLHIAKKDSSGDIISAYNSLFTELGMRVIDSSTNTATLIAEQGDVNAVNLTANQYFRLSVPNAGSRFQEYHSTVHDDDEVGCFWEAV